MRCQMRSKIWRQPPVGGGATHSSMGVVWAYRMLAPNWKDVWCNNPDHPIGPSDPGFKSTTKAIVLLTDGIDGFTEHGITGRDAWLRGQVCTAAKEAGIRIYVVAAMPTDRITDGLADGLRACSSAEDDPSQNYVFMNNLDRADIEEAFSTIASSILVVRRTY